MLPRVKKMWDEYRHMNYLKPNGGVDPCAALEARHAALREAVAWERECRDTSPLIAEDFHAFCASIEDIGRIDAQLKEHIAICAAARAEVDRLMGGGE